MCSNVPEQQEALPCSTFTIQALHDRNLIGIHKPPTGSYGCVNGLVGYHAISTASNDRQLPGSADETSGLRLAVLTSLVRLLEVKSAAMEGEEGTGSLESDITILEVRVRPLLVWAWSRVLPCMMTLEYQNCMLCSSSDWGQGVYQAAVLL